MALVLNGSGTIQADDITLSGNANVTGAFVSTGDITASNTSTFYVDEDNTKVSIGTSSGNERLNVNGAIRAGGGSIDFNGGIEGAVLDFDGSVTRVGHASGSSGSAKPLVFVTAGTEKMRMATNGRLGLGVTSPSAMLHTYADTTNTALFLRNADAGYNDTMFLNMLNRANNNGFTFLSNFTSSGADIESYMRGDGNNYADGVWGGGGADYAEYFEWADGNPDNEDRRGFSVVLVNEKIRKASDDETPIGVISGRPAVIGDIDMLAWKNKYQKDDFGNYIRDENGDRILNPDYDDSQTYISREDRKEWDTVGLMGKLRIRKGQPVANNWIKMRDVSDSVEEWLIK